MILGFTSMSDLSIFSSTHGNVIAESHATGIYCRKRDLRKYIIVTHSRRAVFYIRGFRENEDVDG